MDERGEISSEAVVTDAVAEMEERLPAAPWPRLWARLFDTWMFAGLLGIVIGLVWPGLFEEPALNGPGGNILLSILMLPFILLLDAAVMARFGSTPGKWMVGIRLERGEGGRIGRLAFRRNADLYVTGFFLGMPILNLFGFAQARLAVEHAGRTSWDERSDSWVIDRGSSTLRTSATAILALALNFGSLALDAYTRIRQPVWDRETVVAALPDMNRDLPTFVDEVTRLDRISFTMKEGVLLYEYQLIHKDASPVARNELTSPAEIRAGLADSYCTGMPFFRDRDIPVRHLLRLGEAVRADILLRAVDCRG